MSYFIEKQGEIEQEYFQAGPGKKIYLGRKDKPENAKSENIFKALNYLEQKEIKNYELYDLLLNKLPKIERDQYISKRLTNLDNYSEKKLISSLSEDARTKYLENRAKYLEDLAKDLQTRRRQAIERPIMLKGVGHSVTVAASPTREETEKTKTKKKRSKKHD